jgi:hypothetical protein
VALSGPEEDEEGFAGVGALAMVEAGVGAPGAILEPEARQE